MFRFRLQTSADKRPLADTTVDPRAGSIAFLLGKGSVIFLPARGAFVGVPIEEPSEVVVDLPPLNFTAGEEHPA